MWVLADLRQSTPYYFWKVCNGNKLMCLEIKDTPKFYSKKEALSYLDSLPEDFFFDFKPCELIIKYHELQSNY